MRKSAEGIGGGDMVFEIMEGGLEDTGFMVLYCDDVHGGGGGLLRVIELKGFAVVDEYECDVAVTCMLLHNACLWCGGSDGALYALQVVQSQQQEASHPQLMAPTILTHHSFLVRYSPCMQTTDVTQCNMIITIYLVSRALAASDRMQRGSSGGVGAASLVTTFVYSIDSSGCIAVWNAQTMECTHSIKGLR